MISDAGDAMRIIRLARSSQPDIRLPRTERSATLADDSRDAPIDTRAPAANAAEESADRKHAEIATTGAHARRRPDDEQDAARDEDQRAADRRGSASARDTRMSLELRLLQSEFEKDPNRTLVQMEGLRRESLHQSEDAVSALRIASEAARRMDRARRQLDEDQHAAHASSAAEEAHADPPPDAARNAEESDGADPAMPRATERAENERSAPAEIREA